ncbi:hypothetical protein PFMALIP_05792, partial [Plasmodium falciparum MaliPS096_E11]
YKELNGKGKDTQGVATGLPLLVPFDDSSGDDKDKDPQNKLKSGTIPNDFLRQMFYTLGDYRDICIGVKDNDVIKTLEASGDNKSGNNIKEISEKIEQILSKQSRNNQQPGQKSVDPRVKWWQNHGEAIWDGMICALTYNTESDGNTTGGGSGITQDQSLKEVLLEADGTKPKKSEYEYDKVELKEENETKAKKATASQTTHLSKFVERPPYFRYLEEWGETFCRERAKRLAQIKVDCYKDGDDKKNPKCSCYGEHCDDQLKGNPTNVSDLMCKDCAKYCRFYKKWINRKKDEYDKQENAYTKQKEKCEKGSDNGFCGTPETTCDTAANFLQNLGPCKVQNGEDNNKIFDKPDNTFKPATNCKPCSKFKIYCKNCKSSGGGTKVECNGTNSGTTTITASDIENAGNSTHKLDMLVSDSNTNGNKFDRLNECKGAGIFEGIRKDVWKCGKVCGYNVCKPENSNGETFDVNANDQQIIIINAFAKLWVDNFLEDYNKINKKLNRCMKDGEGYQCIKDCVEKWINTKKEEWGKITERLNEQYKNHDQTYPVRTILEEFLSQTEVNNAIERSTHLNQLQHSKGCCVKTNSTNGKDDVVNCMLQKLKDKIGECEKNQALPSGVEQCITLPTTLEEEEENTVEQPKFCPTVEEKKKEVEDACKAAAEEPAAATSDETNNEDTPAPEAGPPAPAPPSRPSPRPKPPKIVDEHPLLKPALMSSTIMWSIGIGFATFTYFYLK